MNKRKQQAAPQFTIDEEGQELAHAAVAGSTERATMYAEDYRRIVGANWSIHWHFTSTGHKHKYVLVNARSAAGHARTLTVARLVADAPRGRRVYYVDGNRLNLRRDNLSLHKGRGAVKFAAGDVLPSWEALLELGIEPAHGSRVSKRKRQHTPIETPRASQVSQSTQQAARSTQDVCRAPTSPMQVHAGAEGTCL